MSTLLLPRVFADDLRADFAVDAVRAACRLVRCVQRELTGAALAKKDRSPVTVGDFAAQAVIAYRLSLQFADEPLVGEEDAGALCGADSPPILEQIVGYVRREIPSATAKDVCQWIDAGAFDPTPVECGDSTSGGQATKATNGYWTLDPIDGTKGFLRGDQYAVALAFLGHQGVELGVLGCPELAQAKIADQGGPGSLLIAARGKGTWVQTLDDPHGEWKRLHVSTVADPSQIRLLRSVEAGHTDADGIDNLVSALAICSSPIPMDSQAKYAVLAAGGGEALLRLLSPTRPDYREKIWDQAAGSILVEEAGGRVTDLDGMPLDFSQGRTLAANRGVVASNGLVHEALLSGLLV